MVNDAAGDLRAFEAPSTNAEEGRTRVAKAAVKEAEKAAFRCPVCCLSALLRADRLRGSAGYFPLSQVQMNATRVRDACYTIGDIGRWKREQR